MKDTDYLAPHHRQDPEHAQPATDAAVLRKENATLRARVEEMELALEGERRVTGTYVSRAGDPDASRTLLDASKRIVTLEARQAELERAIRFALGEDVGVDWPERKEGEGNFYWRRTLRRLAAVSTPTNDGEGA